MLFVAVVVAMRNYHRQKRKEFQHFSRVGILFSPYMLSLISAAKV